MRDTVSRRRGRQSEDAVERFRDAVTPIAQEVGIEEPPQFFPAHTALWV